MSKRYRGLAFDFNGVLAPLDLHQVAAEAAYNAIADERGDERYRLTKAEHARATELGTELWSMTRGLLALRRIVPPDAPLDHPIVREVAAAKQLEYAKLTKDGIPPLPGMVGVVRWAQTRLHHPHAQGKLAQVSTSPLKELRPFAIQNGLDFDVTIAKGDVGDRLKPDPYAYQLAAKQMGVDPGEAIAVEDSIGGLQSAKAAGYFAVGLALNNEDLGSTADIVVSSPYELQSALGMLLIA